MQELKIFEEKQIRTIWDEVQEKWYFSIVDIVQFLQKVRIILLHENTVTSLNIGCCQREMKR